MGVSALVFMLLSPEFRQKNLAKPTQIH